MKVNSREQAWAEVNKLFPEGFTKHEDMSKEAEHDIYELWVRSTIGRYVHDFEDRLEITSYNHLTGCSMGYQIIRINPNKKG